MPRTAARIYVPLDVAFLDDDKILAAGERAAYLYLAILLRIKSLDTDGVITRGQIARAGVSGWPQRLAKLVECGLVVTPDEQTYIVPAWSKWHELSHERRERHRKDRERKVAINKNRADVYERDGNACRYCGATDDLCVDHIRPLHLGGANDPANMQTLCQRCNATKGRRDATGLDSEQARQTFRITWGIPTGIPSLSALSQRSQRSQRSQPGNPHPPPVAEVLRTIPRNPDGAA